MPIQRLVVVSDAHLGEVPRSVEDALLDFLEEVPSLGDGLLINGDLFGFWFAYRRALPRAGFRVAARLIELARRLPVLMTGGNHDRWGDRFWDLETEIRFAPGEIRLALGSGTAVAIHGDQVGGGPPGYRLKNWLIQSRLASLVFRALPAELGFRIADGLARPDHSGSAARREAATAARQRAWAEARLRDEPGVSLLVMSHSHRPVALQVRSGQRYLNPGAWFDGYHYALATDRTHELRQFRGSPLRLP